MSYKEIRDAFMMGAEEIERLRKRVRELEEIAKVAARTAWDACLYFNGVTVYKTFEEWEAEKK